MTYTPLVSVVVNNYNYGRFLRAALDSALDQTYPHTEVVVVDDGSTDDSPEIIVSYGNQVAAVLKENGGQASALNAGFAVSQGEIVIFLDADDYLFAHAVERVAGAWEPGVAKVQYRLKEIDALGRLLGFHPPHSNTMDSGEVWPILLERGRYTTSLTSGNGFSRAVLDEILPIPESEFRISADGYLVTLAPFYGQVVSIEEALGAHRVHESNLWSTPSGSQLDVDRIRTVVRHDLQKQTLVTRKARDLGYRVSPGLGLRDHTHLTHRLVSYRLDPQKHPVPSDRAQKLVYWGLCSTWRYTNLNRKKRLIFTMWFVWVGLLPLPLIKGPAAWLLTPRSQPKIVQLTMQKVRSLLR